MHSSVFIVFAFSFLEYQYYHLKKLGLSPTKVKDNEGTLEISRNFN